MAFRVLETPRTEFGASVTQHPGDLDDFSTRNSIPSPSKDGHDLLQQIRGMRPPAAATPRSRPPLTDRRNAPPRPEFTPLLKSATRNRRILTSRPRESDQENNKPPTPAGFRDSFRSDGGELPVNSSILIEEDTRSSAGDLHVAQHMPPSSSSVMSTPLPGLRNNNGIDGGNLATLREQEMRLEQIDKENFGLKLKIHFLEEALRKSGKDFNEAALRENTELKVDKVQLQRELRQQRKKLIEALREMEEYKRQLLALMDKTKDSGGDDVLRQEIDRLRAVIAEKDDEIKSLQDQAHDGDDHETALRDLKDDISDLEQQLRAKDNEIDEKQEEIDQLKDRVAETNDENLHSADSQRQIDDLRQQLVTKDAEIKNANEQDDQALEAKDLQIKDLEEDITDLQQELRAKENQLDDAKEALDNLKEQMKESAESNAELDGLHDELAEKEEQIQQLQRDHEQAQDGLSEATKQAEDLKHQLDSSTSAEDLDEAQRLVQQREQELRVNRQELQTTQQKLSDKDTEVTRLLEQARSNASSVELDLRREMDERKQEIDELRREIQGLKEDVQSYEDALRQADQDTERKMREKDRQLELKDDEVQHLEDEVDRLEQDKRQRDDDAHGVQSELNRVHGEAHRSRDEAETELKRRESELAAKNEELRLLRQELRNTDREQSFAAKDGELKDRQEEIDDLKQQLAETVQQAKEDLAEKQEDIKELEEDLRNAGREQSFAAKNEELHDLHDEVDQLKRQLHDVEAHIVEEGEAKEDELRLLEEDHRDALTRLQRFLDDAKAQLRDAEIARTTWERQCGALEAEKLKAEARVTNLEFDIAQQHGRAVSHDGTQHNARTETQRRLQEALAQVGQLRREKQSAEEALAATNDEVSVLQADLTDAQAVRNEAQQAARDARKQLADYQRQSQQFQQSKVDEYEADLASLEEEVEAAQTKIRELTAKNESLTSSITRLKTRLADVEAELAAARARQTSPGATTSASERKDLHEMLRDAKLNAEDLTIQLKESDTRAGSASKREADLRSQLQRVRGERKGALHQATLAADDLGALQDAHDSLADELDALKRTATKSSKSTAAEIAATKETARQHQRELRGLGRQIEYLAARLRREESFRRALSFGKAFSTRILEVHARYNKLDLALVRDMGIPVADVRATAGREAVGRARVPRLSLPADVPQARVDATPRGKRAASGSSAASAGTPAAHARLLAETRPNLRSVALMVLAGVRMRRSAEKWAGVRRQHEGLLKKLASVRRERAGGKAVA